MYILKALCLSCSTSVSEGTAGISRRTLIPGPSPQNTRRLRGAWGRDGGCVCVCARESKSSSGALQRVQASIKKKKERKKKKEGTSVFSLPASVSCHFSFLLSNTFSPPGRNCGINPSGSRVWMQHLSVFFKEQIQLTSQVLPGAYSLDPERQSPKTRDDGNPRTLRVILAVNSNMELWMTQIISSWIYKVNVWMFCPGWSRKTGLGFSEFDKD